MKIVYISNSIIPSRTANSIHVMKMCQAFADNGHEVVLLAPNRYKEYENGVDDVYEYYGVRKNFEIRKLPYIYTRILRNFYYAYQTLKEIKIINPDIVYGRDLYGCFFSSYKYPTIFEAHAPMNNFVSKQLLNMMNKNHLYKHTVVISDALKNLILKSQNIKSDKIVVAHDGADEVVDFDSKVELKGNTNSLKVGYVGSLYKGKGIEVIEKLSYEKLENIDFHIVGGLEKDIKYWKENIQNENVFFYGFVSQQNISSYINSFDICLLPNQKIVFTFGAKDNGINISQYTSPLKMFEYMAHKKAIIVSDLPVLKEVLNEGNSILVDCENVNEWVDAIERLKDSEIRSDLSKKAHEDFIGQYSWKQRAFNLVELVNE